MPGTDQPGRRARPPQPLPWEDVAQLPGTPQPVKAMAAWRLGTLGYHNRVSSGRVDVPGGDTAKGRGVVSGTRHRREGAGRQEAGRTCRTNTTGYSRGQSHGQARATRACGKRACHEEEMGQQRRQSEGDEGEPSFYALLGGGCSALKTRLSSAVDFPDQIPS